MLDRPANDRVAPDKGRETLPRARLPLPARRRRETWAARLRALQAVCRLSTCRWATDQPARFEFRRGRRPLRRVIIGACLALVRCRAVRSFLRLFAARQRRSLTITRRGQSGLVVRGRRWTARRRSQVQLPLGHRLQPARWCAAKGLIETGTFDAARGASARKGRTRRAANRCAARGHAARRWFDQHRGQALRIQGRCRG